MFEGFANVKSYFWSCFWAVLGARIAILKCIRSSKSKIYTLTALPSSTCISLQHQVNHQVHVCSCTTYIIKSFLNLDTQTKSSCCKIFMISWRGLGNLRFTEKFIKINFQNNFMCTTSDPETHYYVLWTCQYLCYYPFRSVYYVPSQFLFCYYVLPQNYMKVVQHTYLKNW